MKKNGFVTTGILFSILVLMIYLIGNIVLFTVKIKYNKKARIDKTNYLLDDDESYEKINNGEEINPRQKILDRIIYTKEN